MRSPSAKGDVSGESTVYPFFRALSCSPYCLLLRLQLVVQHLSLMVGQLLCGWYTKAEIVW